MVILGVDPGLASCGWAVIEEIRDKRLEIRDCGVIETSSELSLGERLCRIDSELEKIIKKNKPEIAAIEQIFFAKNVKTAITIGHVRGVVILACVKLGIKICEFTPLQVKQALTGFGQADKNQVGYMVKSILNLKELPKDDNTVDALALGICLAHSYKSIQNKVN